MAHINIGKSDFIWSYLGTFFKIGTNVLLLPIIISYLTESEIGLWYVFASISQFVTLFDFGFAPSFARNISYVWCGAKSLNKESLSFSNNNKTDWAEFSIILHSCKYVYFVISLLALIILLSVGTIYVIKVSSTDYIYAWIVYSLAVFLNLLYSYYTSFLRGIGAVAENNKSAIISKVVQLLLCWLLLELQLGLLGVSVAYLLSGIVLRISSKVLFEKYENIRHHLKNVVVDSLLNKCIARLKIIWHNSSREGLVTLSNYLNSQANTLICSYMIGLAATGSYGVSLQIATLISTISSIPFSTYQSKMQEYAITNNIESNKKVFSLAITSYIIVFIILALGSLIFIPILSLIKPTFDINIKLYILILVQVFLWAYYGLFCSFIASYNKLPYTKTLIVSAFISVFLSVCLVKFTSLGIWALVLSPIVVSSYNMWKWQFYVKQKYLNISVWQLIGLGTTTLSSIIKDYIHKTLYKYR